MKSILLNFLHKDRASFRPAIIATNAANPGDRIKRISGVWNYSEPRAHTAIHPTITPCEECTHVCPAAISNARWNETRPEEFRRYGFRSCKIARNPLGESTRPTTAANFSPSFSSGHMYVSPRLINQVWPDWKFLSAAAQRHGADTSSFLADITILGICLRFSLP